MTVIRSRKYLNGSRGQQCTLRIPGVCTANVEQTVAAHIRDRHSGKGIKASDLSVCDACWACHDLFDGRNGVLSYEDWLFYALRGLQETIERRVAQGLIEVSLDREKRRQDAPTKPRKPAAERVAIHGNPTIPTRQFPAGSRPLQSRNDLAKSERQPHRSR